METAKSATSSALDRLTEFIHGIDVAMLTTVDRTGHLHSRPMMTLRGAADGALWFFAGASTHMVDDVNGHHPMNISYVDSHRGRYVSVSGRARVVTDRARKAELWERRLGAWLPDGLEDPSVVLLRVEVHDAEIWDWDQEREFAVEFSTRQGGVRTERISFQ